MTRTPTARTSAAESGRYLARQAQLCLDTVRELLALCLGQRRPADRLLTAYFRAHHELGGRDRRLISETSFAVLRWWGWLRELQPSPDALPPALLVAATLLEGLPFPAAGAHWLPGSGLSAADVARVAAQREVETRWRTLVPLLGLPRVEPVLAALSPAWFNAEVAACPRPLPELQGWLQRRPPIWLRAQCENGAALVRELEAAELSVHRHAWLAQALSLGQPRRDLRPLPAFRAGRIEVQDLASQAIGHVCAPRPGQRWWDACAGGGGKTLHLAALMAGKGSVLATDVRGAKLEELRRRARRAGLSNIRTAAWSGQAPDPRKALFDGVLVDAPCSGSGTWRRNPDARWRVQPEDLSELVALQARLLSAAACGVGPAGVLVYATCSLFARENERLVADFLAQHDEFVLDEFAHPLTGAPGCSGMLQLWPWEGDCDAMFVARMRRRKTLAAPPALGA
ncbi:MAG: RsmB/NOP family class I SAM-dependent RNA methyltransferase [Proteobacteria bacterium]|nr:RsmB/NOP family class I SAM-dependent RNA methyltransferase [Pseudomonadota bacterium]